ncbi:YfiT family bacillithiol transferase [Segetibacter aerophilus]|uniref:Putative metal-dependent hydrolase n=1 Tax=Segetibacter aerophilus TaxID=670293 RepID=A0A512BH91_9BACT|nr:putative metal-dependent hydrolase [Segetibacter aerophilus]GEO11341.1 putative metal-dependent hydrolase [Segetibacter aerophilus]
MPDFAADVRYPIGKFETLPYSEEIKKNWINDIRFLPNDIELAIQTFDEYQLDTPYREGGWTVKQLVHHIADSHMNAYIRFKLALTEDNPTIKPYEEAEWAKLPDTFNVPVNVSVTLLHALHRRWTVIIENISEEQFQNRTVFHPEHQKQMTLWHLLGMYAWHSRHHLAHIKNLITLKGW